MISDFPVNANSDPLKINSQFVHKIINKRVILTYWYENVQNHILDSKANMNNECNRLKKIYFNFPKNSIHDL